MTIKNNPAIAKCAPGKKVFSWKLKQLIGQLCMSVELLCMAVRDVQGVSESTTFPDLSKVCDNSNSKTQGFELWWRAYLCGQKYLPSHLPLNMNLNNLQKFGAHKSDNFRFQEDHWQSFLDLHQHVCLSLHFNLARPAVAASPLKALFSISYCLVITPTGSPKHLPPHFLLLTSLFCIFLFFSSSFNNHVDHDLENFLTTLPLHLPDISSG